MLLDSRSEFGDAATLIGGTGRNLIGNVMNTSVIRDLGQGVPIYLVVEIETAVDSAADGATIQFELVSDAQAAIATDGSATEHLVSSVLAEATMVAGYQVFCVALPWEGPAYEKFLGLIANVGVEAVTAGTVNAFLTLTPHRYRAYPDAQN